MCMSARPLQPSHQGLPQIRGRGGLQLLSGGRGRWCLCLTACKAQSRAILESMRLLAVFGKFQKTVDNRYL